MKKRLLAVAMTGALCASMVVPAMAQTAGGAHVKAEGTDVWAGITLKDPDVKVSVSVPTLFAFVVNGGVDGETTAVTSEITDPTGDKDVLLPNLKVEVETPSTGGLANGVYKLVTVGDSVFHMTNLSTMAAEAGSDTAVDGREGLAVDVVGYIANEGSDEERNYWTHVADAEAVQGETAGFKQYTLEVNGEKFSTVRSDGSFAMANAVALAAPDLSVGGVDPDTLYAESGTEQEVEFNVYVGGQKGQYNQVEESAKVGTITWEIHTLLQEGAETAPNNDYLSGE